MNPAAIELAILVIREAIKLEPVLVAGIQDLLSKNDPTPADWEKLRAHTASLPSFKLPE